MAPRGAPPRAVAVEAGAMATSMVGDFIAAALAAALEDSEFHSATISMLAVDVRATLDGIFANLAAACRQNAQPSAAQIANETTVNWLRVLAAVFRRQVDDASRGSKRQRKLTASDADTMEPGSFFVSALADRHLLTLVYIAGWESRLSVRCQSRIDYGLVSRTCMAVVNAAPSSVLRSCRSLVVARCRGAHGGFDLSLPPRTYIALNALLAGDREDDASNDDARDVAELCASFLGMDFSNSHAMSPLPRHLARLVVNILTSSRHDAAARAAAPALFAAVELQPAPNESMVGLIRRARRCDLLRAALDASALATREVTRLRESVYENFEDHEIQDNEERQIDISDFLLIDVLGYKKFLDAKTDSSPMARLALGRASTLRPAVTGLMCASAILQADANGSLAVAAWKLLVRLPTPGGNHPLYDDISIHGLTLASRMAAIPDDNVQAATARKVLTAILSALLNSSADATTSESSEWLLPAAVEALSHTLSEVVVTTGSESDNVQFRHSLNDAIRELTSRHNFLVERALQGQVYGVASETDAKLTQTLLLQLANEPQESHHEHNVSENVLFFAAIALNDCTKRFGAKVSGSIRSLIVDSARTLRARLTERGVNPLHLLPAVRPSATNAQCPNGLPQNPVSVEDIVSVHASLRKGDAGSDAATALASRRALDALERYADALTSSANARAPAAAQSSPSTCDELLMGRRVSAVHALFTISLNGCPSSSYEALEVARMAAILDMEVWASPKNSALLPVFVEVYETKCRSGTSGYNDAALPLAWALNRCNSEQSTCLRTLSHVCNDEGEAGDETTSVGVEDAKDGGDSAVELSAVALACRASSVYVAAVAASWRASSCNDAACQPIEPQDVGKKGGNLEAACRAAINMAGVDAMRIIFSISDGVERGHVCALAAIACCDNRYKIRDALHLVSVVMQRSIPLYESLLIEPDSQNPVSRLASAIAWTQEDEDSGLRMTNSRQAHEIILGSLRSVARHSADMDRQLEALLVLATVLDSNENSIATTLYTLLMRANDSSMRLAAKARSLEVIAAILSGVQRGLACFKSGEVSCFLKEPTKHFATAQSLADVKTFDVSTRTQHSEKQSIETNDAVGSVASICT